MNEYFSGSTGYSWADALANISIQKSAFSITTTYDVDPSTMDDGDALKKESLQEEVVMLTEREEEATYWKDSPKLRATSTVEQYTTKDKIGRGNFYTAGGSPELTEQEYKRHFEQVKFFGIVGRIDGPTLEMSKAGGMLREVLGELKESNTIELIKSLDYAIREADSDMVASEFDGEVKQHREKCRFPTQSIIDLKGSVLIPKNINDATEIIASIGHFTGALNAYTGTKNMTNMVNNLIQNQRYIINGQDLQQNQMLSSFRTNQTQNGTYKTDIFMNPESFVNGMLNLDIGTEIVGATSDKAPVITGGSFAITTPANTSGYDLEAGSFKYLLILQNAFGTSAAIETATVNVSSGQKVVFTESGFSSFVTGQEATCVQIWRRRTDSTTKQDYRLVTRATWAGAKEDTGQYIPGTSKMVIKPTDAKQVFAVHQLLNAMFEPLAKVDDSVRLLHKIYLTPILKNANREVWIINIGDNPVDLG